MIGYNLVTKQTTANGLKVNAVLVHEGVDIVGQIYVAFILDRNFQAPAIVYSTEGGVEIEEVAEKHPDAIHVHPIDITKGLLRDDARKIAKKLKFNDNQIEDAADQLMNLYKLFITTDSVQLEINPWATDPKGKIWCVDAKINIDDNAKFRQEELLKLKKESVATEETDPNEEKALQWGLNYVALDGDIGCMVNGAGLAMATMDVIKLHGGAPANFLDVGGGAQLDQVKTAFEILTEHPSVRAILINIFGGIVNCAMIAEGIAKAAKIVGVKHPLIVRLSGNNSAKAREMLEKWAKENPNYSVTTANDLDDAAKKAVAKIKSL